jgi:hypothetical protein
MPPVRSRLAVVALLLLVACPGPGVSTSDDSQSDTATQNTSESTGTTQGCSIGSEGCSCTSGGACDQGLVCNLELKLCEADASTSGTGTTTGTGETSTGTDTGSTGTGETLGPACTATGDGKESPACVSVDPTRPFCVDDTCVACGALPADACMLGTGGQRPLCLESGACGQCNTATAVEEGQCTAESPHCNLDTNMCEGCFEHSECPATACKIAARKCFPPDNIIYVRQGSPKLPCSDKPGMGGGKDKPYCDFELATAAAQLEGFNSDYTFIALGNEDALGEGMSAVNIAGGDGSPSYAFVHEIGGLYDKHTQFVGIGPMITVPSKITLYIKNFGVVVKGGVGDSSVGVSCSGGEVWLDDSRVLNGRGPNIRSTDCDIHLRRTSVAFGQTEGVDLNGGSLRAVNSFISSNSAKDGFGGGGLHLRNGATIDMLYSTIADNSNEPNKGLGDSIHCDAPSTIKLRNSILARRPIGANSSIACPGSSINITWSAVDSKLALDEGNNNLKKAAEDLLMGLVLDNNTGVFRVNSDGDLYKSFYQTAQWRTGDPHFDFDMSERNTVDAGLDYAGADVLAN